MNGGAQAQAQAQRKLKRLQAQAQAQAAPVPAADMPARPVVQQVQTPMPPPQASAPAASRDRAGSMGTRARCSRRRPTAAARAARCLWGRCPRGLEPVSGEFSHPIPEWFQKRMETKNTN